MRFFHHHAPKTFTPPGTMIHIGEPKTDRTLISVIDYDENRVEERRDVSPGDTFPFREQDSTTWINVDGLHEVKLVEAIGERFGLHPLILEDIVNTNQRPKMEAYDDYVYIVVKMLRYREETKEIIAEQVSLVLGDNFVLSFQECPGDVFESIRERIRAAKGRVRKGGADYLAYLLIDAVVDGYFLVLEKLSEAIELLEEEVIAGPTPPTAQAIQLMRTELLLLRKHVLPMREIVSAIMRSESSLFGDELTPYLNDAYDHSVQAADGLEAMREFVSSLRDSYLSSLGNKTNEVMKVLTIIATIFIPITFIAGIYGMNFRDIPELEWPHGYYYCLGLMAAVAGGMLAYFRTRKWI